MRNGQPRNISPPIMTKAPRTNRVTGELPPRGANSCIAGLLSTMIHWEAMENIDLYGGRDTLERVGDLITRIVCRGTRVPSTLRLHVLEPGMKLVEISDFCLSCFPVLHRGTDSFGFIFERKSRRPFLPERAEALNIPPGPWRRELALGKDVTLPDGRTIQSESVLGEEIPGTKLAVVGDCGNPELLTEAVRGADTLAEYLDAAGVGGF